MRREDEMSKKSVRIFSTTVEFDTDVCIANEDTFYEDGMQIWIVSEYQMRRIKKLTYNRPCYDENGEEIIFRVRANKDYGAKRT